MFAATHRQMTCDAVPTLHKGHSHRGPDMDDVVRGSPKGQTFEKGSLARPKHNNGIRD
jgi:hypothetical protein